MRDMHRERLTHLLANAILELWKKETGSLSSVVIEGTICITSSTGKTTVLQVADRFTGSIPEAEDEGDHTFSPPEGAGRGRFQHPGGLGIMRSLSMPPCYPEHTAPPRVDCQNQTVMAAFLDNLSPASLVSPGTEYSRSSLERRSPPGQPYSNREVNNNHTTPDPTSSSVKEETSEYGTDSVSDDKQTGGDASTGGICAGTGYYTYAPQEMNNNTIDVVKHPLKFHKGRSPQTSPERNKRQCSGERSPAPSDSSPGGGNRKRTSLEQVHVHVSKSPSPVGERRSWSETRGEHWEHHSSSQAADAMDLTRKCPEQVNTRTIDEALSRKYADDLALSPPHSYTAQVRDIIRQRVLAAQQKGTISSKGGDMEGPAESLGATTTNHQLGDGTGKLTPKVLESLGLQRSDGEESGEGSPKHLNRCRQESESSSTSASTPEDVLRVSVASRKHGLHPLLLGPLSPITSTSAPSPGSSTHSPLPSPGSGVTGSNGHLHSILQQHRLFLPLPPLSRPGLSLPSSGPASAPPLFTHPGFSPLAMPNTAGGTAPRDASPSPTDLSLDSSGEGDASSAGGEQRVYRCEYCTKTFLFKSKYHEHLPVHTNARPFQCHLCSRTYKYKYDLRVHLRTHMGIPTKSTVCPFCNTKFDTNKRLRVHIKDAHKDKQKVEDEDPGTSLPPATEPSATPSLPPTV